MWIRCATHSTYPRIGEGAHGQRLRQAYGRRDRGELDDDAFRAVQDDVAREVLLEQTAAGVELVTDGLVRWSDPLSHVAGGLGGVEIGGLVRWFDTNFYVRRPIVTAEPAWRAPYLAEEVRKAVATGGRVRAVVTGPYTLARLSIDRAGLGLERLVEAYARALGREVEAIVGAGAADVQIEEPCLLGARSDIGLVAAGLRTMLDGGVAAGLATYFGNAEPIYDRLQELPVASLALDLVYAPRLLDRIASEGSRKALWLGAVDGRNTALEPLGPLAERVGRAAAKLDGPVGLTTSCGLEYLPRDRARHKTEHLRALARALA